MRLWDHHTQAIQNATSIDNHIGITEATGCDEIGWVLDLADDLEHYSFDPTLRDREDVATGNLPLLLTKTELELILPHVSLSQYGQALIEADYGELTGHGLIERNDGEPVHDLKQEHPKGKMEMI